MHCQVFDSARSGGWAAWPIHSNITLRRADYDTQPLRIEPDAMHNNKTLLGQLQHQKSSCRCHSLAWKNLICNISHVGSHWLLKTIGNIIQLDIGANRSGSIQFIGVKIPRPEAHLVLSCLSISFIFPSAEFKWWSWLSIVVGHHQPVACNRDESSPPPPKKKKKKKKKRKKDKSIKLLMVNASIGSLENKCTALHKKSTREQYKSHDK